MKIAQIVTVVLVFASSAMPAVVSVIPDKLTFDSVAVGSSAHTATLLTSGQVLIVAGEGSGTALSTSEKYDPASGAFSLTGSTDFVHFNNTRVGHTTTLLKDGQALVAGGFPVTADPGLHQPSIWFQ